MPMKIRINIMRNTFWKTLSLLAALAGATGLNAQVAWVNSDVGTPAFPGSVVKTNDATGKQYIVVSGGGNDIWNNSDNFHYYYAQKSGRFDVIMRVRDLQGPDTWSKCELMVRDGTDDGTGNIVPAGGDRHISNMTTRSAGQNLLEGQSRMARNGGSTENTTSPVIRPSYPNTWLRTTRLGPIFTLYYGTDGTNWTQYLSLDTSTWTGGAFADTVLVGIAVTAHNDTVATLGVAVVTDLQFLTTPPDIINIIPRNREGFQPVTTNFTFTVNATGGINNTGIVLSVNGVDKSSALQITGNSGSKSVVLPGPFTANLFYNMKISAFDLTGKSTVVSVGWDTLQDTNFTIEGEDFNFGGGQFIDNPALSSAAGANNYIDRAGIAGIDESDPAENGAQHAYRSYNAAAGTGEMVGTEPVGATEYVRSKFATAQQTDPAIVDYNVGWVDVGEWWNYTRTFTAGSYQMYVRVADGNTTPFGLRMDKVLSDPKAANQVTTPIGACGGAATGGWQLYTSFPILDALGNQVVLPLSGTQTLRLTDTLGGLNVNFIMFVPVSNPGKLSPYLSIASPTLNATGVIPDGVIRATIVDRDYMVQVSSIQVSLNGTNVTSGATIAANAGGASVNYVAPAFLKANTTNTVSVVYSDSASPANTVTNTWSFVTGSVPIALAKYAQPVGSGNTPGFTVRDSQTLDVNATGNTTTRTEAQLIGTYALNLRGFDTPTVLRYWGNGGNNAFPHGADPEFPGIGATEDAANRNYVALEAVAYLDLKRGSYTFGARADDTFRITIGTEAHAIVTQSTNAVVIIDRGPNGYAGGDINFSFLVEQDGLYPMRLTFEQGTGGYNLELFSWINGQRVLINDPNNPNSIKAYRFVSGFPASTISFLTQPTNQTVMANHGSAIFTAIPTAPLLTNLNNYWFQWQKNNQNIPGANTATYTIPVVQTADAGSYRCNVTLLGYPPVATTAASLTVSANTTGPTVASITGSATMNTITIIYSGSVDWSSAIAAGNYTVNNGLQVTAVNTDPNDQLGVKYILSTSKQTPGTSYTVTINGVKETGANNIAANVTATFKAYVPYAGALAEFFDGISTATTVASLTGSTAYINNTPSRVLNFPDFQAPTWENGTYYGGRMTAWVTAPTTGNYIFWLASDDQSELWLSTDDNPANVKQIAAETSWSNQRQFAASGGSSSLASKRSDQFAGTQWPTGNTITLQAGQKYYLMALWKEGSGGDGCAVGWTLPGATAAPTVAIPSANVSININPDKSTLTVNRTLASVTALQNQQVTLAVDATCTWQFGTGTVSYQWQKNGTNVTGGGRWGSTGYYTTPPLTLADNGAVISCIIMAPGITNTTQSVITVNADTAAPVLLSAGAMPGASAVGLLFDEVLDRATATNAANYTVSGANITNVMLGTYAQYVLLSLDKPVAAGATAKVSAVNDLAGNVLASATVPIGFGSLSEMDIMNTAATSPIDPQVPGATYPAGPNAFIMKAGGSDFWNAQDAGHFLYQPVTGDFDAKVQVSDVFNADTWSKATLMAREDLTGIGRHYCVLATSASTATPAGQNLINVQWKNAANTTPVSLGTRPSPMPYPNCWLRLQRVGNTFNTYFGFDGVNWMFLNTFSPTGGFPNIIYLGLGTTSHNNGLSNYTYALYKNYQVTGGGIPAGPPTLGITGRSTTSITVTYTGTLQSADSAAGPYSDVSGAASPATINTTASQKFYRARQ